MRWIGLDWIGLGPYDVNIRTHTNRKFKHTCECQSRHDRATARPVASAPGSRQPSTEKAALGAAEKHFARASMGRMGTSTHTHESAASFLLPLRARTGLSSAAEWW